MGSAVQEMTITEAREYFKTKSLPLRLQVSGMKARNAITETKKQTKVEEIKWRLANQDALPAVLSFTIPGELPRLNQVLGQHWSKQGKQKKTADNKVVQFSKPLGRIHITSSFGIQIKWYTKDRTYDQDNIGFAVKYIMDGLQKAYIIPNDGWKQLGGGIIHQFEVDAIHPRVEVVLHLNKKLGLCT